MATHDYIVDNQNGANFRSDLNNALAAIVSNNSSATAPTTTYAFMLWADTAAGILKQRNAADSAWINILTMATGAPLAGINPSFGRVVRTSGHVTTTSTSLVDVTGATVTITTGAFPVAYGNVTSARNNTPGALLYINIDIDGALEYGTSGTQRHVITNNYMFNASTSGQSAALTAGSHTIKMQWKVSAGSGLLWADASNSHQFYAREIR